MIPDSSFEYSTGVKRFETIRDARLYVKKLLESYEKTRDNISALAGDIMRDSGGGDESQSKGWYKVGSLFANKTDTTRAGLDILFQVLRESKPKIAAVEEALRSLNKFEEAEFIESETVLLYIHQGVPERIVVGGNLAEEGQG